jgi:hypothetical protein
MTQSLDEAGSKIFIKPNSNFIAGWRTKQASYIFLLIHCLILTLYFCCRTMCLGAQSRHPAHFFCPFADRCGCPVKFRSFATAFSIKLEAHGEHSAESHVQDKVTKKLSIPQTAALQQHQCYCCMQPAELIVVGLSLQASILLLGSPLIHQQEIRANGHLYKFTATQG